MASEFMTTREVAKVLGVGLTTVQCWVESGALPAWKTAGGHRRIPRAAVEKLLSEQTATLGEARSIVLIVEDNPVERELYRQHLNEWKLPIQVLLAQDGYEGLLLVGRYEPDFIITDLSMPLMNGIRMIDSLYKQYPAEKPVVVVVTGLTHEEITTMGSISPDIPVYPKPIPFTALRQVLQHHVHSRYAIRRSEALMRAES